MKFAGVGVALVTPFTSSGSIDFEALSKLVASVTKGGVDYLVALGTTAETPTLSQEERKAVLEHIIKENNGRKPIVCGAGGNDTEAVVESVKEVSAFKIDGILSVVPYYNKPSQEGIFQHFKKVSAATELPIVLYNVPGRTVTNMEASTTIRLAKEFDNIVAIKEASGSLPQCMELVQGVPDGFTILSGDDNLTLAQIAIGMHGVISVAANCYTNDFCTMVNDALKGEMADARKMHYKLLDKIDLLFEEGNPAGVKCVLSSQGIIENNLRLPMVKASAGLQEKLSL